ncbi:MAG: hypothetical protein DWC11_06035 [Candidatus Poseidoniales archaeon]|nr:MAG: hypothetical protein DWC11_06035 [Candidatus Poseidoniales archaeon]
MRDSPLRAAARRARRSLGQEEAMAQGQAPKSGVMANLAQPDDRPVLSRPRPVEDWSPPTSKPRPSVPAAQGLEGELARRLSGRVEGHVSNFHEDSSQVERDASPRLGETKRGTPLWQSVLGTVPSHDKGQATFPEAWAWGLRWSEKQTFRQWVVMESNREASTWADHAVAHPGEINPLVIQGAPGSGRSHLLHAIGQALLRRQQGGVVLLRHPASMALHEFETQLTDLAARLSSASGVLVDDLDHAMEDAERCRRLHHVIDLAMNLGVQVVVVCQQPPASWAPSPLARVLQEGVLATMATPGPIDRMAALRSMVVQDGLVVENDVLQTLAASHPTWRSLDNGLRAHLHAPDKAALHHVPPVTDHVETATSVIERALDAVAVPEAIGGVELTVPVPELSDAWEPDVPDAEALLESAPRSSEPAKAVLEVTRDPRVDQLLRPNERDQYLVRDVEQLDAPDAFRAADVMADIDLGAESAILRRRHHAEDQSLRLEALNARMEALADQAREADVEALLAITDELQSIDQELETLAQGVQGPARLARLRPVLVAGEEE